MWAFLAILVQAVFGFLVEFMRRQWSQRQKPLRIASKENIKTEIKALRERLEKLEGQI